MVICKCTSYICADNITIKTNCLLDIVDCRNCRVNVIKKVLKPDCEEYFDLYKVIHTLYPEKSNPLDIIQ